MMFKALATLLATCSTLVLTIAPADNERLRLTLTPHHKDKKKGDDDDDSPAGILDRPIVITGTIDELEVELPGHLEKYAQTRTSLREVFDGLAADYDTAKKEAEQRIQDEKKRTAKGLPTITPPPVAAPKKLAPASIF